MNQASIKKAEVLTEAKGASSKQLALPTCPQKRRINPETIRVGCREHTDGDLRLQIKLQDPDLAVRTQVFFKASAVGSIGFATFDETNQVVSLDLFGLDQGVAALAQLLDYLQLSDLEDAIALEGEYAAVSDLLIPARSLPVSSVTLY